MTTDAQFARALQSLRGIATGDGFGMQVLKRPDLLTDRTDPFAYAPWRWSDDTAMAISIVENLARFGCIEQDDLMARFVARYEAEPRRGYGGGAVMLLRAASTTPWRIAVRDLFGGQGSYGNGGAMRAAPIGAWFSGDPARAALEAQKSAEVTHAHPEGQAGAVAIAVAAAIVHDRSLRGASLIEAVLEHVKPGDVAQGLRKSLSIPKEAVAVAVAELGTGASITAQDTVPFCVWVIAWHADSFEDAMWTTISGMGDGDTTCAIVGGTVALASPPPRKWLESTEPVPAIALDTTA